MRAFSPSEAVKESRISLGANPAVSLGNHISRRSSLREDKVRLPWDEAAKGNLPGAKNMATDASGRDYRHARIFRQAKYQLIMICGNLLDEMKVDYSVHGFGFMVDHLVGIIEQIEPLRITQAWRRRHGDLPKRG